jgi:hypothetical protein
LKLLPLLFCCLLCGIAPAQQSPKHTCRILFLDAPDDAPDTLHLFDGVESREVDLPRMNLSKIYQLRSGPLKLSLLPAPPADPAKIPAGAPSVSVAEGITDFYLLVSSDPANTVAPVRMQLINAGSERLKPGQMLWFNLTRNRVGGTVGSQKLIIEPAARLTLDPPAGGDLEYPVDLSFRIPGDDRPYPLCETRWRHNPRSRSLAFIIAGQGVRTPRVLVFPDYRETPTKTP